MSSNHNQHNDKAHDQAFFRTFGMVLAALAGIFAFCIFAASFIVPKQGPSEAEKARLEARIQPVAKVITDPAALIKASASAAAREPMAADQIYTQICAACHNSGVLAAPKVGDKSEWAKRMGTEGGLAGLSAAAIKGKGQMPARGGNPDLSDDEVKATVKLMLEKSGI